MRMTVAHRQVVTFYARDGRAFRTRLPSLAAKWQPTLHEIARGAAVIEASARICPASAEALQMVRLFADCKARMMVSHRRSFP